MSPQSVCYTFIMYPHGSATVLLLKVTWKPSGDWMHSGKIDFCQLNIFTHNVKNKGLGFGGTFSPYFRSSIGIASHKSWSHSVFSLFLSNLQSKVRKSKLYKTFSTWNQLFTKAFKQVWNTKMLSQLSSLSEATVLSVWQMKIALNTE